MAPTFETKHHGALAQFAAHYFYVARIRLKNAILLWTEAYHPSAQNDLMSELVIGYKNYALYDFALLLFDAKENLCEIDNTYEAPEGSAIFKIIEFRRHVLAHRGSNWGTDGSRAAWNSVTKDSLPILNDALLAAKEFFQELKKRNIKIYCIPAEPPLLPLIKRPKLQEFLNAMPKPGMWVNLINADEEKRFFEEYTLD